jgi:hypothetical protein
VRTLAKVNANEVRGCCRAFAVLVKRDGLCSEAVMGSDRSEATEHQQGLYTNNRK